MPVLRLNDLNLGQLDTFFHASDLVLSQSVFGTFSFTMPSTSLASVFELDDLTCHNAVNYSDMAAFLLAFFKTHASSKLPVSELLILLHASLLPQYPYMNRLSYSATLRFSKSLPSAKAVLFVFHSSDAPKIIIEELSFFCVLGINSWERAQPQPIMVSFELVLSKFISQLPLSFFYEKVSQFLSKSSSKTLEALTFKLSTYIHSLFHLANVVITVVKPLGTRNGHSSSFTLSQDHSNPLLDALPPPDAFQYYLSIGSNVEPRLKFIHRSIRLLEETDDVKLVSTSHLYETEPMYLRDQDPFLNCVILVETRRSPQQLLAVTQSIENQIGRQKFVENGPRRIDIDLVSCKNFVFQVITLETLKFPHPRYLERAFVLRPMLDISPNCVDLLTGIPVEFYLSRLSDQGIRRVIILNDKVFPVASNVPFIMGILNITPDSFYDGNLYNTRDSAKSRFLELLNAGADVIDIGAQSTKPGANPISADEEISRLSDVFPALSSSNAIISLDTFHSSVVLKYKDFIHCINDISGGTMDLGMFHCAAQLQLPYVLTHIKGDPQTMCSHVNSYVVDCSLNPRAFIDELVADLTLKMEDAFSKGIYRWNVIVDPGIGFAKNSIQNLAILEHLDHFQGCFQGFPVLIGASLKRFIGEVTGAVDFDERIWGSLVASVCPHPWMTRVHDPRPYSLAFKLKSGMSKLGM